MKMSGGFVEFELQSLVDLDAGPLGVAPPVLRSCTRMHHSSRSILFITSCNITQPQLSVHYPIYGNLTGESHTYTDLLTFARKL